jgi:hypothetical protein
MKKRINYNILELTSRTQFVPAKGYNEKIELVRIKKNAHFNFQIPFDDQLKNNWWGQLSLNNSVINSFLAYPEVHFFLPLYQGKIIGSFDMIVLPDREVEIKNFGLTNDQIDFEIRAMFLSKAVDYCFKFDPKRIFFQANEFEQMSSISNYLSQGFMISTHDGEVDAKSNTKEKLQLHSNFLINLN